MIEFIELHTDEDLGKVWKDSFQKPVLLFKHSTTCPVSARAFGQYKSFLESANDDIDSYLVKVIEDRSVSNQIAEETSVKHESPQIFLIRNKEVVWHTSHSKITVDSIGNALKSLV